MQALFISISLNQVLWSEKLYRNMLGEESYNWYSTFSLALKNCAGF